MKKYLDSTICWPLAIILFILCLISCYTIKCAAGYITYPNPTGYWSKQLLYYMIGVGLIFLINRFGNDRIYSGMWIFYGILIVFLVGLVIQRFAIYKLGMHIIPFAKDLNGATSWYNFPGFSFQPSEFMKVVMIICMSKTVSLHNEKFLLTYLFIVKIYFLQLSQDINLIVFMAGSILKELIKIKDTNFIMR